MTPIYPWLLLVPMLAPVSPAPDRPADDCRFTAERVAEVNADRAREVFVDAKAGSLRIVGVPGLREVRVRGEACASSRDLLDQIGVEASASGDAVRIAARIPDSDSRVWGRNRTARLDLVIEVPDNLPLDVRDSSGSVDIRDVAAVTLDDSSGGIDISGVRGDVRLTDSSGSMDVRDVSGSVIIERDGSGGISISRVRGDVLVRRDSSGSIEVADVGGDFSVGRDGSGGIRYSEVSGNIDIPTRERRRR